MAGRYGNVNTGLYPQPDPKKKPDLKYREAPAVPSFSPEAARAAGAARGRDPQSDARVRDSALRVAAGQRPAQARFYEELAALANGDPNFDETPYTGGFGEDQREQRESYGPEINDYFAQQFADQMKATELAYLQAMSRQAASGVRNPLGMIGGDALNGLMGAGRSAIGAAYGAGRGAVRAAGNAASTVGDFARDAGSAIGGLGRRAGSAMSDHLQGAFGASSQSRYPGPFQQDVPWQPGGQWLPYSDENHWPDPHPRPGTGDRWRGWTAEDSMRGYRGVDQPLRPRGYGYRPSDNGVGFTQQFDPYGSAPREELINDYLDWAMSTELPGYLERYMADPMSGENATREETRAYVRTLPTSRLIEQFKGKKVYP